MSVIISTVSRSKNTIRFGDRVDDRALRDVVPVLYQALGRGYPDLVLDFRRTTRAYADSVLPIISLLDHRRQRGNSFRVLLPEDAVLRQLFLNTNWAHLMDPDQDGSHLERGQHLAARRYLNHAEQQSVVDSALDVVLKCMELRRDVITALEWSLNEVTDNVLNHAQSAMGGLVQVDTFRERQRLKFVVADSGRGIPAAMREAFPRLRDDEALSEAVKPGVTSIPDSGQGNGLAGSLRIATYAHGSFKITSGRARLIVHEDPRTKKYRTRRGAPPHRPEHRFPGTTVMMELSTATPFEVEEALALDGTRRSPIADVVDLRYSDPAGDLVIRVCEEGLGFGTRHAGIELRRKAQNLLNAEPTKRLVLDWNGVPLISSSYADEAVGKLFVELGPTAFTGRVLHAGAEPLVSSLLDRAIMQRVAQVVAGHGD